MNINRDEALRRLNSPNNLANRLSGEVTSGSAPAAPVGSVGVPEKPVHTPTSSSLRRSGDRGAEVPEGQRDLIARAALLGLATQKDIGAHFGVPQQVVSTYKSGQVTPGENNAERKAAHGRRVEEIRDLALEKTMAALGLIDGAKLENLEAKDLGRFAKDMSAVYNQLAPKDAGDGRAPIQLLVYAPKVQDESRYKVVDV
jgi:hypothetical protein